MENPYAYLRKLTRTSQKDFGEKYGFSKTTMIYIESGQYPELSEKMINSIVQECSEQDIYIQTALDDGGYGHSMEGGFNRIYNDWQRTERIQAAHKFQEPPPSGSTPELSPFHFFIKQTTGSVQSFCKTLKVPAASVLRYTTGKTKQMPSSIRSALLDVRYPYLRDLEGAQATWIEASAS